MKKIYLLTLMAVVAAFLCVGVIGCDETSSPTPVVTEGLGEGDGTTVVTNLTNQQLADEYKKKLEELSGKLDEYNKIATDAQTAADAAQKSADESAKKQADAEAALKAALDQANASGGTIDPATQAVIDKLKADIVKLQKEAEEAKAKAEEAAEDAADTRTQGEGARGGAANIQNMVIPNLLNQEFYSAGAGIVGKLKMDKEKVATEEEAAEKEEKSKDVEEDVKAIKEYTEVNDIFLTVKTADYTNAGFEHQAPNVVFSNMNEGITKACKGKDDKKINDCRIHKFTVLNKGDFADCKDTGGKCTISASTLFQKKIVGYPNQAWGEAKVPMKWPDDFRNFKIVAKSDDGWIIEGVKLQVEACRFELDESGKVKKEGAKECTTHVVYENPCVNRTIDYDEDYKAVYFSQNDIAFCTLIETSNSSGAGTDDDMKLWFSLAEGKKIADIKHEEINFEWIDQNLPYPKTQGTTNVVNDLGWDVGEDGYDDFEKGDLDDYSIYLYDESPTGNSPFVSTNPEYWQLVKEQGNDWDGEILISVIQPGAPSKKCYSAKSSGELTDTKYALPGNTKFGELTDGKCPEMFTMDKIEKKFDKAKFDAFKVGQ